MTLVVLRSRIPQNELAHAFSVLSRLFSAQANLDLHPSDTLLVPFNESQQHLLNAKENPSIYTEAAGHPRDSLAQLVRSCGKERNLLEGRYAHSLILHGEHRQDVFLGNLLVQMYGRCKSPRDARVVFDSLYQPNFYSWNMMIQAYTQNGHLEEAKNMFEKMPQRDAVTWNVILYANTQNGQLQEARSMFEEMPERDVVSCNALVAAYAQKGHVEEAKNMFDRMPQWNVVSWNSVVQAYARTCDLEEAKRVFDKMPDRDVVSWNAMVTMYAQRGHLEQGKSTFDRMEQRDMVSWNAMITAYVQEGRLQETKLMFDRLPERNAVTWNSMITAYAHQGHVEDARAIFDRMPHKDLVSWTNIILAYAQNGDLQEAQGIYERMPHTSMVSCTAIIAVHAQKGHLQAARALFESMPDRDVVTWTAMIQAYAHKGHVAEAKHLFDTMPAPNTVSWTVMLLTYAENGHFDEAKNIFEAMPRKSVVAWTALIQVHVNMGDLEEARNTFQQMPIRNVVSWTTMIWAYAQNGHYTQAAEVFQLMNYAGMKPDEVTFRSILTACSHVGLVAEGWHHFVSISQDHAMVPLREHYCCMIDILGRAGDTRRAEELIDSMPFMPDVVTWIALLGACRLHRDIERGERAARQVFELEADSPTAYVALANMYSSVGRKDEALMIRNRMKLKCVKKLPGISNIEIGSKVHTFMVGDTSHPRHDDTCAELQRLSRVMKEAGYVPDTKEVLHDVTEEEKEELLHYHSEKMAVAFGLIATDHGTPLRIVKNLRVCSDCHSAIKFIARMVERTITVRDANRFHHFRDGLCSCGDYW